MKRKHVKGGADFMLDIKAKQSHEFGKMTSEEQIAFLEKRRKKLLRDGMQLSESKIRENVENEGFRKKNPQIINIKFLTHGKMHIYLDEGRIIIVPVSMFPSIKKLSMKQRRKWYLIKDEIVFFDTPWHSYKVEQFLGHHIKMK